MQVDVIIEAVELLGDFLSKNGVIDECSEEKLLALAAAECFIKQPINRNRLLDICEYIMLTNPSENDVVNDANTVRLCVDIVGNVLLHAGDFLSFITEYRDLICCCASQLPYNGIVVAETVTSCLRFIAHIVNMCPLSERVFLSELAWASICRDCLMTIENSLDAGVVKGVVYLLYCAHCQVVQEALDCIHEVDANGRCCSLDENKLLDALRLGLLNTDESHGACLLRLLHASDANTVSDSGLVWAFRLIGEFVATVQCSWGSDGTVPVVNSSRELAVGPLVQLLLTLLVSPESHLQTTRSEGWDDQPRLDSGSKCSSMVSLTREEQCELISTLHGCLGSVPLSCALDAVGRGGDRCGDGPCWLLLLCARVIQLTVEVVLMRTRDPNSLAAQTALMAAAASSLNILTSCYLESIRKAEGVLAGSKGCNAGRDAPLEGRPAAVHEVQSAAKEYLELLEEKDVLEWVVDLQSVSGGDCASYMSGLVMNCAVLRSSATVSTKDVQSEHDTNQTVFSRIDPGTSANAAVAEYSDKIDAVLASRRSKKDV